MKTTHRGRSFALGALALAVGLLLASGCAHHREIPQLVMDADPAPKRLERHIEHDLFHHWSRTVYRPNSKTLDYPAAADQSIVLAEWGQPDFLRKPFRDFHGEKIREWLYIDEVAMFQFRGDQLVYEGPITDLERILLERGYPDSAEIMSADERLQELHLTYRQGFWPIYDIYSIVDGKLIFSTERN